jgi:hypothetical protein
MIEIKNKAVLRDGQQIALIEDGVCRSYSAIPPVLKSQIKKAAGNPALTFELVEAHDGASGGGEAETPVVQPVEAIEPETPVEAVAELEAQPLPRTIADLHALAEKGTIPPPPPTHEALGSRTPALVQWVKAHLSPEDFAAAYRNRKLPTVEEVEAEFGKLSRTLAEQERASKDKGGIRF